MSTYDSLKKAIENNGDVKSILEGQKTEAIKEAFLLTDPLQFSLLQFAVMRGNKQTVKELLDKAQALGILKDVLLTKGIQGRTVLTWARNICKNNQLTEIIKIIEQGAEDAGLRQQSQQPVGAVAPFQEVRPELPQQSGQGQAQGGGSISHLAKLTKDFNELMSNAGLAASNHQSQQPVGTGNGAFVEVGGIPTQPSGQRQAQGGGSVLTSDKLMEGFHKLTPKQKSLHKRLSDAVYSGGNVYDVLKDIKKDKDKKDILTTSAVYGGKDRSIPDKIIEKFTTRNLLTLAIERENVQATKEILQECKRLGILKQVLTTQSITIADGHQEVSIYALHHAILCSDTKFCTEILNAASNEPDLLKKLFDLTLIYTNADRTETYTPLELAKANRNTEAINIINRKMQENGLADSNQQGQQHVGTEAPFQEVRPALPQQGGHDQAQGGRDTRDQQQKTFDDLCDLVLKINDAKGADQGQLMSKFSQKLDEASHGKFSFVENFEVIDSYTSTAVQFVTHNSNNQQCIKTFFNKILPNIPNNENNRTHISDTIKFSLNIEAVKAWSNIMREKNVIEGIDKLASDTSLHFRTMVLDRMTPKSSDNFKTLCKVKTILNFLNEQNVGEKIKSEMQVLLKRTDTMINRDKPFSWEAKQAQSSIQPPVGAGNRTRHVAQATPSIPTALPQGVREPFEPPMVVPASGQSSLPPKVTKQVQPIQPDVAVPAPSVAKPASGQSSLLPQANQVQSNLTPVFVPASPEADATFGQSPLSPGSAQNQLTGTDDSSSDNPIILPGDLGDQSTKTPTFWSENRGKITFTLGVVGAVIAGCAFIAGLPYEAACAIAVIGVVITAIAIGILGKMAYEAVSEQAKTDNTSKLEDTGTMLSGIPPCINLQEESRKR